MNAELTIEQIRDQAHRYLLARYGPNYVYRAPETFTNAVEQWIWAVGAGSAEIAEQAIKSIEDHFAHRDGQS